MVMTLKTIIFCAFFISNGFAFSMIGQPSTALPASEGVRFHHDPSDDVSGDVKVAIAQAKAIAASVPDSVVHEVAIQVRQELSQDEGKSRGCFRRCMRAVSCRVLTKTLSYRCLGTLTTMLLTYIFTGDIGNSAAIGALDLVSKLILYYLHERVWECIAWGKEAKPSAHGPEK